MQHYTNVTNKDNKDISYTMESGGVNQLEITRLLFYFKIQPRPRESSPSPWNRTSQK